MCREFEQLKEEGRKEGQIEARQDIARKMLAAGRFALEEIADLTSLPLEDVRQLAAELPRQGG